MPSKAEFYRQMAEQVSTQLVGSWKEWTALALHGRLPLGADGRGHRHQHRLRLSLSGGYRLVLT